MTDTEQDGKYRFPQPNEHFPEFFSFWPDENRLTLSGKTQDEALNELHYAVFGRNGPVYILRGEDGEPGRTTLYDMWMEDRAVGLSRVSFEESGWSDYYRPPDGWKPRERDTENQP